MDVENFKLVPGETYRRRRLHEIYGGQVQGGISTPARYPIVLLFTGKSGRQYGYEDTWLDADHFDYVGEGQRGDMELAKGNAAVVNHAAHGESLHLFEDLGNGMAAEVILTRNEVDHARIRYPNVCLFVVSEMELRESEGESPVAIGGTATILRPWLLDQDALRPIAFSYKVPYQ